MRRRGRHCLAVTALAVLLFPLSAGASPEDHRLELGLLGSYSFFLDTYEYLFDELARPEDGLGLGSLFPSLFLCWHLPEGRPLVVAGRFFVFWGGGGHGFEATLSGGVRFALGPLIHVLLLPSVGVIHLSGDSGIPAWTGVATGPVFSLQVLLTATLTEHIALVVAASADSIPTFPMPGFPMGFDLTASLGVVFRIPGMESPSPRLQPPDRGASDHSGEVDTWASSRF